MSNTEIEADEEFDIAELQEIRRDVESGKERKTSVRELLSWFGAHRRGSNVVEEIDETLEEFGLRTEPDFKSTWIDAQITYLKVEPETPDAAGRDETAENVEEDDTLPEMTFLVRMLEAANRQVVAVKPEDPIESATTLMMAHDFSQLAVMKNERELRGAISWKSIGSRLSQRNELTHVSDAIERTTEVLDTETLFEATRIVIEHEFVFVRSAADRKITGIVTATDLSEQFQSLSEPFLLLGRIENQLRKILQGTFDIETLRAACDENDPERKDRVTKVSHLTFGEYQRILEKKENWDKIGFVACRKQFCQALDDARQLRNEIMHFHPDVIEQGDFEPLRRLSRLLNQLEKLSR